MFELFCFLGLWLFGFVCYTVGNNRTQCSARLSPIDRNVLVFMNTVFLLTYVLGAHELCYGPTYMFQQPLPPLEYDGTFYGTYDDTYNSSVYSQELDFRD